MISKYYIFGAHPRGWTMFEYLRALEPQTLMLGFLYDNDETNPKEIDGIPVSRIIYANEENLESGRDLFSIFDMSAVVYIATRSEYHKEIRERLSSIGFKDIVDVTPELDMELRNRFVEKHFRERDKIFYKIKSNYCGKNKRNDIKADEFDSSARIYIAKTHTDKEFDQDVTLNSYERIIQVGCALTDKRLSEAESFDNDGDNISSRNSQCCELTALYWIWKHTVHDIVGLEHWRRRFLLPVDWVEIMDRDNIDVVLPVPLCVMPSLEENYKYRHLPYVWDEAFEIIKSVHPDDYKSAKEYFRNNSLYSPCNMIIARKKVLDDYCEWMFPIILELNDRIGTIDDRYQNRYPGFVSERLLTYFFDVHVDEYNVAYADKNFLR